MDVFWSSGGWGTLSVIIISIIIVCIIIIGIIFITIIIIIVIISSSGSSSSSSSSSNSSITQRTLLARNCYRHGTLPNRTRKTTTVLCYHSLCLHPNHVGPVQ